MCSKAITVEAELFRSKMQFPIPFEEKDVKKVAFFGTQKELLAQCATPSIAFSWHRYI